MTEVTGEVAQADGKPTEPDTLAEAILHEEGIRAEAEQIRGEATTLTPELFLKLWPLLRRPIPPGFIVTTEAVKGKPYPSTGVKSIQVLTDRMDSVLTPLWWDQAVEYQEEGRLACVTVWVGTQHRDHPLVRRSSMGGVNQASTTGNLYKGSYTNAAKRAFALLGVAHEVYLGATDFDPDTDPDAAKAQEGKEEPKERKLPAEKVEPLKTAVAAAGLEEHLIAKLRGFGASRIEDLSVEQAVSLYEWAKKDVRKDGGGEAA